MFDFDFWYLCYFWNGMLMKSVPKYFDWTLILSSSATYQKIVLFSICVNYISSILI